MSGTTQELEMLKRQIAWLDVYVSELQHLEQPNMPAVYRERALRIRNQSAPMFFQLVASLLHDALIQGLANILAAPRSLGQDNVTLESEMQKRSDPELMQRLTGIRNSPTYRDIKRARNKLLSHADRATVVSFDTMTPQADFPNLRPSQLQSMVVEIRNVMAEMTGEIPDNFIVPD